MRVAGCVRLGTALFFTRNRMTNCSLLHICARRFASCRRWAHSPLNYQCALQHRRLILINSRRRMWLDNVCEAKSHGAWHADVRAMRRRAKSGQDIQEEASVVIRFLSNLSVALTANNHDTKFSEWLSLMIALLRNLLIELIVDFRRQLFESRDARAHMRPTWLWVSKWLREKRIERRKENLADGFGRMIAKHGNRKGSRGQTLRSWNHAQVGIDWTRRFVLSALERSENRKSKHEEKKKKTFFESRLPRVNKFYVFVECVVKLTSDSW